MDQKLKQRLVGLAVIFSLAVIFVPMLLDGPEPEMETLEVKIPPSPELAPLPVRVEEKVIELRRQTDDIEPLQPRIVDEDSEPPVVTETLAQAQTGAVTPSPKAGAKTQQANEAKVETKTDAAASTARVSEAKASAGSDRKPAAAARASTTDTTPPTTATKAAEVKKPVAAKPPAPRAEARPLTKKTARSVGGDSFIVQLGSFTDRNKAYALRDRVRKLKLAAVFIEKFSARGTTFYRVRVGPFVTRDKARVVLNKLRAKYNIKGQVMTYDA